jgi:hypothetical protein
MREVLKVGEGKRRDLEKGKGIRQMWIYKSVQGVSARFVVQLYEVSDLRYTAHEQCVLGV